MLLFDVVAQDGDGVGHMPGAEHLVPVLCDENHVGMLDKTQFRKIGFAITNVTKSAMKPTKL